MIYAAARDGWATADFENGKREGVDDLLNSMINSIPSPNVDATGDLKMLITQTESNQYFGRMLIGRIH